MKIPVKEIIAKDRIRKDMGDIESLAFSFKQYGQITPIIINNKNVLIAGGRRLEAAKFLGWETIDAVVVNSTDKLKLLELEVEENKYRKDFEQEEIEDAEKKIYKLKHPSLIVRIWRAIVGFFKKLFRIKD
jgi:ParB family chromosome partitioning protein